MGTSTIVVLVILVTGYQCQEFSCPREEGQFQNPESCESFYHCTQGVPELRVCGEGLEFNARQGTCDWKDTAACTIGYSDYAPIEDTSFGIPTPGVACPNAVCRCQIPDPKDCSAYYRCLAGKAYHNKCSKGLLFNPVTTVCDLANNVPCGKTTAAPTRPPRPTTTRAPRPTRPVVTRPPVTRPPPTVSPICQGKEFYPHEWNCRKFYHCDHGIAYLKDCPSILHWSTATNRCEWPCDAKCDRSLNCEKDTTTTTTTTRRPPPSGVCKGEEFYPHETNCGKFYHCAHGVAYLKDCPSILHWSTITNRCEWPCDAKCDLSLICEKETTTTTTTTRKPTPPSGVCKGKEFYPHKDCGKFYHCSHGIAYVKDCPSILHWSTATNRCEWPCDAKCDSTLNCEKDTTTTSTTSRPPTSGVCKGEEFYPHEKNCGQFYHCAHGIAYLKDCPSILHWSTITNRCEWPCDAKCDKSLSCGDPTTPKIPTRPTPPTNNSNGICTHPDGHGLYPDPNNCERFFHCSHGIAHHKWCPAKLHFNPTLLVCDWPYRAGCVLGEVTSAPPVTPGIPDGECDCGCCILADKDDCGKFYLCVNNKRFHHSCSEGLLFNPDIENCDHPDNVVCGTTTPIIPPACKSEFRPHETDCGKFYHCSHGIDYLKNCPSILHWSTKTNRCEWPCDAGCDSSLTGCGKVTTPETITVPITFPICTHPDGHGLYPDPKDCRRFYHCSHGVAHHKWCPAELHFNPVLLVCDWPNQAGCNGTGIVTPTPKPIIGTCECDCCILADKDDCSKFFLCENHEKTHHTCSHPLLFNQDAKTCDHPENVDCGKGDCECKYRFAKHDKDCGKYYECKDAMHYERNCPAGTHWNARTNRCSTPCEANCDSSLTCGGGGDGKCTSEFKPHPNCRKFFHCSNGIDYLKDCPSILHWSTKSNRCEWPCDAGCDPTLAC